MEDDSFARLMDSDQAFRDVVQGDLAVSCQDELSQGCLDMGQLAERQLEREKRHQGVTTRGMVPQSAVTPQPGSWLEGMAQWTDAARAKLYRDRFWPPKQKE